jgi:hypothetical protein
MSLIVIKDSSSHYLTLNSAIQKMSGVDLIYANSHS